jgi:ribosome-associated protein
MSSRPPSKPAKSVSKAPPKAKAGSRTELSSANAAARDFAIEAARLLHDDKCLEVMVMDVRKLSQVTDYIVLASGTSDRQMRSSIKNVEEMGATRKFTVFRSSSDDRASWLLADFVDVIVHVFEPNMRAHYDLEMLWGDAPRIEWERAVERPKSRRAQ